MDACLLHQNAMTTVRYISQLTWQLKSHTQTVIETFIVQYDQFLPWIMLNCYNEEFHLDSYVCKYTFETPKFSKLKSIQNV